MSEQDEREQQAEETAEQAEEPAAEQADQAAAEAGDRPEPEVEAPEEEPAAEPQPATEPEPAAQDEPATEDAPATEPEPVAESEPAEPEGDVSEGDAEREPEAPVSLAELAADARYTATGKRKSSVARVILKPGGGDFLLNGRPLETYFPRRTHRAIVMQPLDAAGYSGRVDVVARIHGGGVSGQADALRHGIAKALIEADPALRGELKRRQLLTRDPRVKERRKAGLKKARKRPQFSKR
jgi:small subunit ribosomal protein S9